MKFFLSVFFDSLAKNRKVMGDLIYLYKIVHDLQNFDQDNHFRFSHVTHLLVEINIISM